MRRIQSGIKEGFARYFKSLAGLDRREALKLMGTGALVAPTALSLNPPSARAANSAPGLPQPEAVGDHGRVEETATVKRQFNPCGMTREPSKFTGPFQAKHITYIVNSPNEAHDLPLRVLLPDKLGDIASPRLLYVLPAEPGIGFRGSDCLLTVENENLHNKYGLIAVSPSFSDWPWYANHPKNPEIRQASTGSRRWGYIPWYTIYPKNPEIQQETYFIDEIVPFIDKLYPKASRVRLLVGMSKSGNGAYQMLLRHPDLFHAAAIFDSPIMANSATQFQDADIYGDNTNFMKNYCIPQLLLERAGLLRGKPPRLALFGYCLFGGPNPVFGPHHQEAHAFLESLGIRHIYDDGTCRNHRWDSGWLEGAVAALDKMTRS